MLGGVSIEEWASPVIFLSSRFSSAPMAPNSREGGNHHPPLGCEPRASTLCLASHTISNFAGLFRSVLTRGSIAPIPGGTSRFSIESIWTAIPTTCLSMALLYIRVKSSSADRLLRKLSSSKPECQKSSARPLAEGCEQVVTVPESQLMGTALGNENPAIYQARWQENNVCSSEDHRIRWP